MDDQHLHLPLLSTRYSVSAEFRASATDTKKTTTTTSAADHKSTLPTSCIALRLLLIIFVGIIAVWANNEASKGFMIRVVNEMKDTPAGDKFSLFYVANDEATRLVQSSAAFATKILYSNTNSIPNKLIDHVDVHLASHNSIHDHMVVTKSFDQENKYVISISPMIMEFSDFKYRIRRLIQRGLVEVLLFDNQDRVPKTLLHGMVEYVSDLADSGCPKPVFKTWNSSGKCWEDTDPKVVARFLGYCEGKSEGFVVRLHQAMSGDKWDGYVMEKALGTNATHLCESFHISMLESEQPII